MTTDTTKIKSEGISVLMAEYNSIIKEKHLRMEQRLKLMTLNVGVSGALMTLALERQTYIILLILPLMSSLFGLLAAYESRGILDIARHVRLEIAPLIKGTGGKSVLIWDVKPSPEPSSGWIRLWVFQIPTLASFLIPPIASLVLFCIYGSSALSAGEILLFILGLLMLIYCAITYVWAACLPQPFDSEPPKMRAKIED